MLRNKTNTPKLLDSFVLLSTIIAIYALVHILKNVVLGMPGWLNGIKIYMYKYLKATIKQSRHYYCMHELSSYTHLSISQDIYNY